MFTLLDGILAGVDGILAGVDGIWQGSTVFWQALDFRARVIYLFNRNFAKFSKKVYVLIKIARKKRALFQVRRDGQQKAHAY